MFPEMLVQNVNIGRVTEKTHTKKKNRKKKKQTKTEQCNLTSIWCLYC